MAHHQRLSSKRSIDIMAARQSHIGAYNDHRPSTTDTAMVHYDDPDTGKRETYFSMSRTPSISSIASPRTSADRSRFLKRLFTRHGNVSKPRVYEEPIYEELVLGEENEQFFNDPTSGLTGPSPNTHPLLCRPQAREEKMMSSIGPPRSRATTNFDGYGHLPIKAITSKPAVPPKDNASIKRLTISTEGSDDSFIPRDIFTSSLREREQTAVKAAAHPKHIQEWGFFIKCYSEGRFNTSNPPEPPPKSLAFDYLRAPVPPNEVARLEAVDEVNLPFPDWASQRAGHIVRLAMRVFQTRCASISFFDAKTEIIKAECGLGRSEISRKKSLGSHVLLSSEPMVILDTLNDWRVQGHPLVLQLPYTRFYAGAPLVTSNGQIVGVFAVFDPRPKAEFGINYRRRLTDFAKYAMTDVEIIVDEYYSKDEVTQSVMQSYDAECEERNRKRVNDLLQKIEEEAEQAERFSSEGPTMVTDTPPQSDEEEVPEIRHSQRMSLSSYQKTRDSCISQAISNLPTPPQTPARPFSISTVDSFNATGPHRPPNTPANGSRVPSMYDDPAVQRKRRLKQLPEAPGPFKSHPEAHFAISLIARNLGFDTVYLLRVLPAASRSSRLATRLIVAHGMPSPEPVFDASLHLLALQSAGGLTYQNEVKDVQDVEEVGYKFGILLPFVRDGAPSEVERSGGVPGPIVEMDHTCQSGVVLAAYTKKDPPDVHRTGHEVNILRDAATVLRDIFIDADHQSQMI